jgi:diguanylate cyclase (GGDEF)-like protein
MRRTVRIITLFLGLICLNLAGFCRAGLFEQLSLEQGLSHSNVTCIFQDYRGFLWFGTSDGLNRYDGYTFKIYRNDPADTGSLSDNSILSLCGDDRGGLWVGTASGLNRLDLNTGKIKIYRAVPGPDHVDTLSDNHIYSVHRERTGTLWVGTAWGVNRFDREKNDFQRFVYPENEPHMNRKYVVRTIYDDTSGNLWLGTGWGLGLVDREAVAISHFAPVPVPGETGVTVTSIVEPGNGMLWVGTEEGKLYSFDTGRKTFKQLLCPEQAGADISFDKIFSMHIDGSGQLWLGSNGGIIRYKPGKEEWMYYRNNPRDPNSLSDNEINAIFQDTWGIIWFGTYGGGIDKYDKAKEWFGHYRRQPGAADSLSNDNVLTVYEDKQRRIWVGTDGGLNLWDRRTGSFKRYTHDPRRPDSLQCDFVKAVCEDGSGNLWIGTFWGKNSGLNLFNEKTGGFSYYPAEPGKPSGLSSGNVTALHADKAGILWIGTSGGGLNRFDVNSGRFARYINDSEKPGTICSDWVSTLMEDSGGHLWIGTEGGLSRTDKKSGIFLNYTRGPARRGVISNNRIRAIYEDRSGVMWVGTENGLNRFDKWNGTFRIYTDKDGLPSSMVLGILEDEQGNLWLSTSRGLSHFDPRAESFGNFDFKDGLRNIEFNNGSCWKSRDGDFFFGGKNGLTRFSPSDISVHDQSPPVVITDFKLFNISRPLKMNRESEGYAEVVLSYKENFFSFEFAALDFTRPEKNRYKYKMEGLHEGWVSLGTRRFAGFARIPPGEYVFKATAANHDGFWNPRGAVVPIRITPPFWRTWWFLLMVLISGLGVVYWLYRYRVRSLQRHRWELKKQVDERTVQLREANQQLELLAREDGLTHLLNKRTLSAMMETECRRAQRAGLPVTVIMLDVDFFKLYNDTYGHQAGDDCLVKMADALKRSVKRPADLVCRYGGEEFLVFLYDTDLEGGIIVAKRIRENIAAAAIPFEQSGLSDVVTVSAGIATFVPTAEFNRDIIILAADTALYQAKAGGRNRVFLFDRDSPMPEGKNEGEKIEGKKE